MRTGVTENTPAQAQWAAVTASTPTAARVQDEKRDLFMLVLVVVLEAHQQLEGPVGPEIARSAGVLHVVQAQHGDGTPAGSPAERIFCRCVVHRTIAIDGHRGGEGPAVHAEERLPGHGLDADELPRIAHYLDASPGLLAQRAAVAHPGTLRRLCRLRRNRRDRGPARLRERDADRDAFVRRTGP